MTISFGSADKTLCLQGKSDYSEVEKKIKTELFLKLPESEGISLKFKTSRFNEFVKGVAIGTLIGVGVGGAGGFALGGPPGAMAGGLLGGALGGTTGGTVVYIVFEITKSSKIKQDLTYKMFKDRLVRQHTINIFNEQIKNDTVFDPLCCSLSYMLPEIPVKAPCGHVYDKAHIEDRLDRNELDDKEASALGGKEGHVYTPRSSCGSRYGVKFTKSDLVFEESHMTKIIERCLKLREIERKIGKDFDRGQLNRSILLQGLDAVLASSRNILVQIAKVQQAELLDSVNEHKGKVKYSDFIKEQKKLLMGKGLFDHQEGNTHKDCAGCNAHV